MPAFLLTLLTSGSIKWIAIVSIFISLAFGLYSKHNQIVELEKAKATYEYSINQLKQNVKDQQSFIDIMNKISLSKSNIIADLYIQKDKLEEKTKQIEIVIENHKSLGHDRPSSKILQDTFRALQGPTK